ncbi:hypothetical protein C2L96_25850 [Bacillus cereus]|uniref:hypothetical protein n=1 Tax=Bacillus cereus group sp. Bc191 TaxID=3018113 RepID=UPI000CCC63DA|nr:hypothetical protein [Bacillus cereus group sp. Bc191]MDA2288430.1 hypothetical protein [Bacillus cereus group sp. Bc191]PNU09078.1 hypothetical protein C2L96_25850 [Bacillus cereus]
MKISKFIQRQAEQEHKIKTALTTIKYVTDGQFVVSGRDVAYNSINHSYHEMIKQFKAVKEVLLQDNSNNKELVSKYIAKTNEVLQDERFFTLSQVVLILLGIQVQSAYDVNDRTSYKQYLKEVTIWQDIIQRANDILKGGNL